ncbi:MAG: LPXTG cell wall anchor domain-containing protein [Propionibacteriaceae bacterium]|nr:LPXTG cell wall anchor domain-containing protein [Propionibacteriaceae bacterium]
MNKGVFVVVATIVLGIFLGPAQARADDWVGAQEFKVWSADGSRLFHFIPEPSSFEPSSMADARVYAVDPLTGNQSLLYVVQGLRSWAYEHNFYFTEDFMSFAHVPQPTRDVAVEFFTQGVLVRTYEINDLVKNRNMLTHSTSAIWWEDRSEPRGLSLEEGTLTLRTVDNRTYQFDITTGAIIQSTGALLATLEHPFFWVTIIGVVILAAIAWLVLRRRKARTTAYETP